MLILLKNLYMCNWILICRLQKKKKLTCENSFSYPRICYFSAISITRIKMIFHTTNVFINLVKVMQSVQDEMRKWLFNKWKTFSFLYGLCPFYIWLKDTVTSLVTSLITWTRHIHHERIKSNPITNISHSPMKDWISLIHYTSNLHKNFILDQTL